MYSALRASSCLTAASTWSWRDENKDIVTHQGWKILISHPCLNYNSGFVSACKTYIVIMVTC